MAMKVLHKKSNSVVNGNPVLPSASSLDYGEIAINYKDGKETIAIKNDNGEIATFVTAEQLSSQNPFKFSESNASAITSTVGDNSATSEYALAVGESNRSTGEASFASGYMVSATGDYSFACGNGTAASGESSLAEGVGSRASGASSHAEGDNCVASGMSSHAEGNSSWAIGLNSHAEGEMTSARTVCSHAEGSASTANGWCSHAQGYNTIARNNYEHAEGILNVSNTSSTYNESEQTIHSVGIGDDIDGIEYAVYKNAFEIMRNGDVYVYGVGDYDGTNAKASSADTLQTYLEKNEYVIAASLNDLDERCSALTSTVDTLSDNLNSFTANTEVKSNKVTTISSASTDVQYPSALAVYKSITAITPSSIGAAASSHTHDEYSLTSHTHTAAEVGAASSSHTHSEYSLTSHTHSDYSLTSHTHTAAEVGALATGTTLDGIADGTTRKLSNYSLTSHTHSDYSLTSHTHSNYSLTSHTHTASDIGAAAAVHQHDVDDLPAQTTLSSTDTEIPTGKAVMDYISGLIASPVNYKGAITTGTLPGTASTSTGDMYVVTTSAVVVPSGNSGTGEEVTAETGDYLLARDEDTWDVIEKNLTGAVTSSVNLTGNKFVLGNGNQTVKASSYGPSDFASATAFTSHTGDTTIHVTTAQTEAWDGKQDSISDLTTIRNNATSGASAYSIINTHTADTSIHVTTAQTAAWSGKQDAINDLTDIRNNATSGATAYSAITAHTANTAIHVTTAQTAAWDAKANTASPAFTGTPTAPNPSAGDNSTRIATTSFVNSALTGVTLDNVADGSTRKLSNYSLTSHTHTASEVGALSTGATLDNVADGTTRKLSDYATQANFTAHTASTAVHLPTVTSSDNGKILRVVNGAWALVTPVTIYSGMSEPSNSLGENGDIYLQTQ